MCGPTASGKSGVVDSAAAALAESSGLAVPAIAVDSMQVYRELPVVTNQFRERAAELTGVVSVTEEWTVARHRAAAEEIVEDTAGPFALDAGTGMYLNAIVLDVDLAPKVSDKVRAEAARRAEGSGNTRREARRLELEMAGAGDRGSIWDGAPRYPLSVLYVRPPRDELDRSIAGRSRRIVRDGADEVAEVMRRWRELGAEPNDSVKQSVGFRELAAYVGGEASLEWAEEKINVRTRRLARRQMRWFDKLCRSLPETVIVEEPEGEKALRYMSGIIRLWD